MSDDQPTIDPQRPFPFELWLPASKLAAAVDPQDERTKEDAWEALCQLRTAANALSRAYIAAQHFKNAFDAEGERDRAARSDEEREERRIHDDKVVAELGVDPNALWNLSHADRAKVERIAERMWWASGHVPHSLMHAQIENAYREYILAINDVRSAVEELGHLSVLTRDAKNAIKTATKYLDPVRLLRDSVAHPEDRGVGRDRKGKPIEWTNPEEMGMRVGKVLKSSAVAYGPDFVRMTAGDGTHPTLPITINFVAGVCNLVQNVVDALEWEPEGWAAAWLP